MPGTVAILGCGGLGVPAAWTLALAGVTDLLLIDADVVELSNLHRQVLYDTRHLGRPKAQVLAEVLARRYGVQAEALVHRVQPDNLEAILAGCQAVIEATDDAASKFAVNDWAVAGRAAGQPRWACIAAAIGRRGQWFVVGPAGPDYRSVFEAPPPNEALATCAIAGVLGPVTGITGALAARSLLAALAARPDGATGALLRWEPRGLLRTQP